MQRDTSKTVLRPTRYRWTILALLVLFILMNHADRANIGAVLPLIQKEYLLTNLQAGALASFFFLGYALTQVPAGLIIGKIGSRILTALALFGFSLCTFLIGTSAGPTQMKWYRFGLGFFEGIANIGGGALLKAWYPPKEQGTVWGIYFAASQVAIMAAQPIVVAIAVRWGWRMVFYTFAAPGIILSILWYIFVRNKPGQSRFCNTAEQQYILQASPEEHNQPVRQTESMRWIDALIRVRRGAKAIETNVQVFRSWNIWADSIAFFFIAVVGFGLITWIPSYLVHEKGLSMVKMGFFAALPFCGTTIGSVGGGWVSDRLWQGRRKPMIFLSGISELAMMYLLADAPSDPFLLGILLFLTGLSLSMAMPACLSYPMGLTTRKTYPAALGLILTMGTFGGFFTSIFVGYLLDVFKTYAMVFYFFALAVFLALVFVATTIEPLDTMVNDEHLFKY